MPQAKMSFTANINEEKTMTATTPKPLTIKPGDTESVEIESTTERWTECVLSDGTLIRIKPVILDIQKVKNQTDQDGNPIFLTKSTLIVDTKFNKKDKQQ